MIFTDVDRRGGGVVEFSSRADQEYAVLPHSIISPEPYTQQPTLNTLHPTPYTLRLKLSSLLHPTL